MLRYSEQRGDKGEGSAPLFYYNQIFLIPSHIGKALQPQKEPNFPFLITISSLQLGQEGSLTKAFACLEHTGIPFELNFVAKLLHLAQFIKIRKRKKEQKEFKNIGKKQCRTKQKPREGLEPSTHLLQKV